MIRDFKRYLRKDSSFTQARSPGNAAVFAQHQAEEEAREGSFMLADRCNRAIQNWAHKHRILPEQAMILLMDRRMPR